MYLLTTPAKSTRQRAWTVQRGQRPCQGDPQRCQELIDREAGRLQARVNRPRRPRCPDGAQALIVAARLVSSDAAKSGARSARSREIARAARIARIASGSSTVAIKRRRPPHRGHASTLMSNARRIRFAHGQCREGGAAVGCPKRPRSAAGASKASADPLERVVEVRADKAIAMDRHSTIWCT
jgi:hypothetical protein